MRTFASILLGLILVFTIYISFRVLGFERDHYFLSDKFVLGGYFISLDEIQEFQILERGIDSSKFSLEFAFCEEDVIWEYSSAFDLTISIPSGVTRLNQEYIEIHVYEDGFNKNLYQDFYTHKINLSGYLSEGCDIERVMRVFESGGVVGVPMPA